MEKKVAAALDSFDVEQQSNQTYSQIHMFEGINYKLVTSKSFTL